MVDYKDYTDFLNQVGYGSFDAGIDVTHDGYPLSARESKFISLFLANGNINQALKDSGLTMKTVMGKDYIKDEIKYRLDCLKKETIADADEILTYLTDVMRGKTKDQFGLDAPLSERTAAARELARRVIDIDMTQNTAPEIKVSLNWDRDDGQKKGK